jgi:hypothetical protein
LILSEEAAIEDFFGNEQVLLGPILDDELGVLIQVVFSEQITFNAFKSIFNKVLRFDPALPNSEFPHIVEKYLSLGITQDEAEKKAGALCERAAQNFADYAYQLFKRKIQANIYESIALLKTQAVTHAQIVLDKTSVEDEEGLCAIYFTGVDPNLLLKQACNIAVDNVEKLHAEAGEEHRKLIIEHTPKAVEEVLRFFEQVKDYHNEQKGIFFERPRPRNALPNNEKWKTEWLVIAKARYGEKTYASPANKEVRFFSEALFEKFADPSAAISNPMKIAQGFLAKEMLNLSGEYFRKTIFDQVPTEQKPKRHRQRGTRNLDKNEAKK